jgi:YfiH family protein
MKFSEMHNSLISYRLFEQLGNVIAFTTTRSTFTENDVPRFTGNPSKKTDENREKLAEVLKIKSGQLVFPRQTHSSYVAKIYGLPEEELEETDALITNQPGICLCVQTADCVPILLYDPKQKAVAAVHAGWRGTVKKIAGETIEKMKISYHSHPEDILAAVGPSIGPDVYEVGDEVVKAVRKNIPGSEKTLHKSNSGKFHLNLWEANRQILLECGLIPENIETLGECTFQRREKYYSARREGIETGRLVSGIMRI